MLIIGSHVGFNSSTQLLGSLKEALSYGSNCFMFYTGAPQNTNRSPISDNLTNDALLLMRENQIAISNIIVHAPYIINLGNIDKYEQYLFSINFLKQECKRCEKLSITKLVLHPGSYVTSTKEKGIESIVGALNNILKETTITILLETMAGKGTEIGSRFDEIKTIIDKIEKKDQIGICLDTCHLSDAGYDISSFDDILDELEGLNLLSYVKCVHINDSKNISNSHKDRHANIGYGLLGFDNIINIIYNDRLKNIPKILETPWVGEYPPYKFEINMIKEKRFNDHLEEDLNNYYKK